jgi:hypothetical protein
LVATVEHPKLRGLRDLVAEANASGTHDATLSIQHNRWAERKRLHLVNLLLNEATWASVVLEVVVLQLAVTRLVTHRTIKRVVNKDELKGRGLRVGDILARVMG